MEDKESNLDWPSKSELFSSDLWCLISWTVYYVKNQGNKKISSISESQSRRRLLPSAASSPVCRNYPLISELLEIKDHYRNKYTDGLFKNHTWQRSKIMILTHQPLQSDPRNGRMDGPASSSRSTSCYHRLPLHILRIRHWWIHVSYESVPHDYRIPLQCPEGYRFPGPSLSAHWHLRHAHSRDDRL